MHALVRNPKCRRYGNVRASVHFQLDNTIEARNPGHLGVSEDCPHLGEYPSFRACNSIRIV